MRLKLLVPALAFATALSSYAVPARPGLRAELQPDGSTIMVQQVGDEYQAFTLTEDGYIVTRGADGGFYFGRMSESGVIESTGILATNPEARVSRSAVMQKVSDIPAARLNSMREKRVEELNPELVQVSNSRAIPDGMGLMARNSSFPRKGDIRGIIILVEYADVSFTTKNVADYFNRMLNEEGFSLENGTGSCRDFFVQNSNGQFRPTFDVFGPYKLPNNRAYYGAHSSSGGNDIRPGQMIKDALALCAAEGKVNFANYDNDNDNVVDYVYVFYAGRGEASGGADESIWPHSSSISGVSYNGKSIQRYACSNELLGSTTPDGIGTFTHEFSHVLALPDLYATSYPDGITQLTPGKYTTMDQACYNNNSRTPAGYSAYERTALGWMDPITLDKAQTVVLDNILDTNTAYLIPSSVDKEFFLIENRQLTGWDRYIPGHGMLVWHIDFVSSIFNSNIVNNQSHQYVRILSASNTWNNNSTSVMAGYVYPGTSGNTTLTATSTPSLTTWTGESIKTPITNIKELDGLVVFDVLGGSSLKAPEPNDAVIGTRSFSVNWPAVSGATDYEVTVKGTYGDGLEEVKDCADMGTNSFAVTLPSSWSKSSSGISIDKTNYGESANGAKMKINTYIQSKVYASDIHTVSLWAKASSAGSYLTIYGGKTSNDLSPITELELYDDDSHTFDVSSEIPDGIKIIKIELTKVGEDGGTVTVDDITVVSGGTEVVTLDDYTAKSTGGATSITVDKLLDGCTQYSMTVRATNGEEKSGIAKVVKAEVPDMTSGVDNIVVDSDNSDAPVIYYNLNGVQMHGDNLAPGLYIRRQGNEVTKVIVK